MQAAARADRLALRHGSRPQTGAICVLPACGAQHQGLNMHTYMQRSSCVAAAAFVEATYIPGVQATCKADKTHCPHCRVACLLCINPVLESLALCQNARDQAWRHCFPVQALWGWYRGLPLRPPAHCGAAVVGCRHSHGPRPTAGAAGPEFLWSSMACLWTPPPQSSNTNAVDQFDCTACQRLRTLRRKRTWA